MKYEPSDETENLIDSRDTSRSPAAVVIFIYIVIISGKIAISTSFKLLIPLNEKLLIKGSFRLPQRETKLSKELINLRVRFYALVGELETAKDRKIFLLSFSYSISQ